MKIKVCFLVAEHPFLDARIFKKEAKSLLSKGYDVTMIVPRVNGYLFDIDGTFFTNQFHSQTFIHEGIKIVTYERMYLEKHIKKLNYNIQSKKKGRFIDPLTQLGLSEEADIYHAHEFFSLYSGVGIKRALKTLNKKSIKLIYDSHELVPDPHEITSTLMKKYMMSLLQSMLREVDYVITVSESIKAWYLSINPFLPVEVIYNSPPLTTNYEPKDFYETTFRIVHEGFVGKTRGNLKKIIEITEICNQKMDIQFKIIGGTKKSDQDIIKIPSHLSNKIELVDWVNYYHIPKEMKNADIGWIDLNTAHSLNNMYAMPNKLFSYLNNGLPVLANKCTDIKNFIQTHQCGLVVNKSEASVEDYCQAILHLCNNRKELKKMSLNARKIMEESYCWEKMEKRLFAVYDQLSSQGKVI